MENNEPKETVMSWEVQDGIKEPTKKVTNKKYLGMNNLVPPFLSEI